MFEQFVNEAAVRFGVSTPSVWALVRGLLSFMTNERMGGVDAFVDLFRQAGLGDVMTSWFGGKPGKPITPSQIESALGTDTLDRMARSSGLMRMTVASILTYLLPKVIGRLTPQGVLPSNNALLSEVSSYIERPSAKVYERAEERHGWPPWVPLAAAAALVALGTFFWLRSPAGTIDPQLTLMNRDGKVTYSGLVRDAGTQTAIVNELRRTFGAANIDGDLKIDHNVKRATWLPRLGDLFTALKTPGVEFSLDGNNISLGGWLSAANQRALNDKLHGIFGRQVTITLRGDPAVEAVQTANDRARTVLGAIGTSGVSSDTLVQALNLAIINFPTGSAEIPLDNMDVLLKSAEAIKRTPESLIIQIGGHTDSTEDPARSLALSQARAEAVKGVLVIAGVPPATLVTRGYGDTKPKASNDTEYGRFQNRRIEYTVLR